ncbi:Hypothetical predicted protein [Mytilus galloprovincialis]|uniref:Uncharacterized protein n=1 Tax=Mytilus galloprovincialis TaxID=29158 RepID=A0A8B6FXD3_MYTGA|nr:Hypothetical predicted protein [Mytilus galloprovincialis]
MATIFKTKQTIKTDRKSSEGRQVTNSKVQQPWHHVKTLKSDPFPLEIEFLSDLEARIIAKRIPFMKLMNLPRGKHKAVVGLVVNVLVDIVQTCASLSSEMGDMGFILLKSKGKK